jgi:hypothetical protein
MPKKPHLVEPDSFNDSQEIADRFLGGEVVAIDLVGCEPDMARRLIDFSSGICYAGDGEVRRVGKGRYLLLHSGTDFDSPSDPDGPPFVGSGAAALAAWEWIFTDAVSTVEVA